MGACRSRTPFPFSIFSPPSAAWLLIGTEAAFISGDRGTNRRATGMARERDGRWLITARLHAPKKYMHEVAKAALPYRLAWNQLLSDACSW